MIEAIQGFLAQHSRCPDCEAPGLVFASQAVRCRACGSTFPIVDGAPALLAADNEVFPRAAYTEVQRGPRRRARLSNRFPWKAVNLSAGPMLAKLAAQVAASNPAHVLVIGSGNQRDSLNKLFAPHPHVVVCYSDVDVAAAVDLYCDGHELPFQSGVFQGVIASAVLEHVLYPERVIAEMHRVLHEGGVVYSEIPFMQQVHEGAYDFTRYSLSGHRRAFHDFEELSSGVVAGPGTALVWAMEHFFASLVPGRVLARLMAGAVRTLFFWVKYADYLTARLPAAVDGASCTYFLGRKSSGVRISDRDVIDKYAGRNRLRHV